MSKYKTAIAAYLAKTNCVIADGHQSSRVRLASVLVELGATMSRISLVGTFEDAVETIKRTQPKVILCDYYIGRKPGLDLIQEQRQEHPDAKDTCFILVSSNSSQAAVAHAAEEDVDSYILKPYTLHTLRAALLSAFNTKLFPSEYIQAIEAGKERLFAGDADAALVHFNRAMTLDPTPTLACFYRGQADVMKAALNEAGESYNQGLTYNRIHYKCLLGIYEVFMNQNRYEEAYGIVKLLSQYFPANPKRLGAVLRLAVVTKNYQDVDSYYQSFKNIQERTDELVRYMCSALVVSGRYFLSVQRHADAIDLFEKATVSSAGRTNFIRYSVEKLAEANLLEDAMRLFKRFPAHASTEVNYLACDYLLKSRTTDITQTIQYGKTLVRDGVSDALVYRLLIEGCAKAGHADAAEDFAVKASQLWPDQKPIFDSCLAKAASA